MKINKQKDQLLAMIRKGKPMTLGEQARLVLSLATPAILAQLTTTMMAFPHRARHDRHLDFLAHRLDDRSGALDRVLRDCPLGKGLYSGINQQNCL